MSLTSDHGNIIFECDGKGCHDVLDTGTSNFDSALNVLRRNRWKPVPRRNPDRRRNQSNAPEWDHLCPECQHGASLPLEDSGRRNSFAHNKSSSEQGGSSV